MLFQELPVEHYLLDTVGEFSYDNLNKRIIKNDLTNEYNINLLDWKYVI